MQKKSKPIKQNISEKLARLRADLAKYEEKLRYKMKGYRGIIHESASSELKHAEVSVLGAMVDGLKNEIAELEKTQSKNNNV